ncbi:MAG: hypothetical protein IIB60_01450 [Planctomycetes bacterium]|nr:hypothetical protein [Planctomycetota bacterium]
MIKILFPLIVTTTIFSGCASQKTGILVMAHGGGDAWNRDVESVVEPLRANHSVEIAFGMARTSTIREGVRRLEESGARRIAVVRMFVSGDSFLQRTERIFGLRDAPPVNAEHASHMAGGGGHGMEPPERIITKASFAISQQGVGASSLVDEILADRVKALSTDPANESVLILAHGPGDEAENERWLANMRLRAQRVHKIGPFRHVQCETLREDWPQRRTEAERRIRAYVEAGNKDGGRVIVVPFRIAGFGPYRKILDGLTYVADERGFCPHPNMTRWIEQTADACFASR